MREKATRMPPSTGIAPPLKPGARAARHNGNALSGGELDDAGNLLRVLGKHDRIGRAGANPAVVLVEHQVFRAVENVIAADNGP